MQNSLPRATQSAVQAIGLDHLYRCAENSSESLVVVVHGRAGTAAVVSPFCTMLPGTVSLFCPQGWVPDTKGGWSWWSVESSASDGPERELSVEKLLRAIERFCLYYQLQPRKILVAGFSQGAVLLAAALQTRPALFSAVVLMAGFVPQIESAKPAACPVLVLHGEHDDVVSLSKALAGAEYLISLGCRVEVVTDPVAHKVGGKGMRRFKEFMNEQLNMPC